MIRPVSYADVFNDPNFPNLLKEYGDECSALGTPKPQPDLYELLEKSGGMQIFGVYEEKILVGFAAVLIYVLPHFGIKVATTESIFITRDFRHLGLDLMETIEGYAKVSGCEDFLYSAPVDSRFDRLLNVLEYDHINNAYLRKL
jgi:hypothetical protein